MAAATGSKHRPRGVALCLTSAAGFALMALLGKGAYAAGLSVTTLLALRFLLSAGALWAIVARARPPRPARGDALRGLALGAVVYALECAAFFLALTRLDASLASLVQYVYPALVVAGAILLGRERATRRRLGALGLALAGVAFVVAGGGVVTGGIDPLGLLLALGAAAGYATYILTSHAVVARVAPLTLSALVTTGAAGSFWVAGLATGTLDLHVALGGWAAIAGLVVCSTIVPITAFLAALPLVGAGTASILATVEPVITVALAVVVLGDALAPLQLAGAALVLAVAVLVELRPRRVRGDGTPAPRTGPAAAGEVATVAA